MRRRRNDVKTSKMKSWGKLWEFLRADGGIP